jgi:uncharacterized protein YgbK (DUF1537 family)
MHVDLAIVADDLTGAADSAAPFARAGAQPIVTWERTLGRAPIDGATAIAIDLESRHGNTSEARAAAARVVSTLQSRGVSTIYLKCDSLLRGHLGAESAGALSTLPAETLAIVAPAFPAQGRTTAGGRQHRDGVAIDRPAIAEALEQSAVSAQTVSLAQVRSQTLTRVLRALSEDGVRAAVCDAETEADLRAIAGAGLAIARRVLWVGSGGLARVLPELLPTPAVDEQRSIAVAPIAGPILFVVGSPSRIAQEQAARVAASGCTHVALPLDSLVEPSAIATLEGLIARVERHLRDGSDVLVTIEGANFGAAVEERPALAEALGTMLRSCGALAGALVVTGGDTATGVLRAWDTVALRLLGEVEPGVPLALSVAARPIPVVTKAGSFGNAETLVHAANRLRTAAE